MILETKRLILRNFKDKDLDTLFSYRNDNNCAKYQRWKDTSRESLKDLISKNKNSKIDGNTVQLAISLKATDELIGDVFVAFKDKVITLGYTIAPKYQRNGYAFEIISAIKDYLFDNFEGYEIVGLVHPDNEPSKKLLEKLDFINEGYAKVIDSIIYSMK